MPHDEPRAPCVNILLSTYNGERYLRPQLDSLIAQDYPHVHIRVRDDGSTDRTIQILQEYVRTYPNLILTVGPNLGPAASFFALLEEADPDCTYFAFCDQDDVWLPDKVSRAVTAIRSSGDLRPTLYFSRVEYVDAQLQSLGVSRKPRRIGFGNALVENCAPGCTMLMNERARQLLLSRVPRRFFVHDSWCYLVMSALGHLVFEDAAPIKYRQHGTNVLGAATNPLSRMKSRLRRFAQGQPSEYHAQAMEFSRLFHSELDPGLRQILDRFLSAHPHVSTRLSYALTLDVWRQSRFDNLLLRLLVLLGHL